MSPTWQTGIKVSDGIKVGNQVTGDGKVILIERGKGGRIREGFEDAKTLILEMNMGATNQEIQVASRNPNRQANSLP